MKRLAPYCAMVFLLFCFGCSASYPKVYSNHWLFWCQWSKKSDALSVQKCRDGITDALLIHPSFDASPAGKKAKQELINMLVRFAYTPLELPPAKVLGQPVSFFPKTIVELKQSLQTNQSVGFLEKTDLPEKLNFIILSSIFEHIDQFVYSEEQPNVKGSFTVARYQYKQVYDFYQGMFLKKREVFLYPFFWSERAWLKQMAYLLHESTHAILPVHIACVTSHEPDCDYDGSGAYGKEIFLLETALYGADQHRVSIPENDIQLMVLRICEIAKDHILVLSPSLQEIATSSACDHPKIDWIAKKESFLFLGKQQVASLNRSLKE